MTRRAKIATYGLLGVVVLLLAFCVTGIAVLQSDWFKNKVRERIVSVAQLATGGRVEIGSFSYNWRALTAEVSPFVLHGTEPASARPLFRANTIRVHLKIISLFEKKVDIAALVFENPQANVTVAADGSTNFPRPKLDLHGRGLVEQLLDLKVQHIELHHGQANYNSWNFPLDASGEGLQVSLRYESAGPRYICTISAPQARISSPKLLVPATLAIDSKVAFSSNRIRILSADLSSGAMSLHASGDVTGLSEPRGEFDFAAALPLRDLGKMIQLPVEPHGEVDFHGHANAGSGTLYKISGELTGRDLAYSQHGIGLSAVSFSTRADVTPELVRLPDLDLSTSQGRFRGSAQLAGFQRLSVKGNIDGVTIAEVGRLTHKDTGNLSGSLSGPLQLDGVLTASGLARVQAGADLALKPGSNGLPVEGALALNYDQRNGKIVLGNSQFAVGASQASVSGTLGETVAVHAVSRNLDDSIPVLRALGATPPAHWPVSLQDGVARIDASVTGSLPNPRVSGKAEVERLKIDGHQLDRFVTTFNINSSSASLLNVSVQQGSMRLEGQGSAGLNDWKLSGASPISALATLRSADLGTFLDETGMGPLPAGSSGTISATLRANGSLDSPLVTGNVTLQNLTAYEEHFADARAGVTFTPTSLELANGVARNGLARIALKGSYNHPANDWKDGSLRFDVSTSGLDLAQLKHVQEFETGLRGRLEVKAAGAAKIVGGRIDLTSLNGDIAVRNAAIDGQSYGDVQITAATHLPLLTLTATATVQNYRIQGSGEWRMGGDYNGEAHIQIPRISFATLHDLVPGKHLRKDLPFGGYIEGDASISGPLNHPSLIKGAVLLSTVQFNAGPNARPLGDVKPQDLVLRNSQPIRLEFAGGVVNIGHANFIAKDTTIDTAGRLALNSKSPWDLNIQGRINFSILELFNPDLLGAGASNIKVSIRGPLMEPQVDGRLDLRNVSLFLRNVPNGIDQANGVILFDRNRATIQNLTAQTGGGDIKFENGSFVGFRGAGLVYRLQAEARNVRYRSGNGVSMTMDGGLALVGTSDNSVLSGTVSVMRAAFSPRTDLGALLASTAKPVAETTPNDYLNGMQLDIHVITTHTLEVETAMTRNIQADADVRLRGTTDRPVLLGNITVNSGQMEFFGNKYTINRGEINFSNPARIEPNINMDLSTKVRGITVDITFSGTLNNLNFSYRSDPPLEASDIIALLAVGRTPAAAGPLASPQTANNLNSSYLGTANNSLLSQAIAPNQGRLQKFFGVSHIKIDPQLNDITIVPQARLTMEQQVSSDITLTYITNLAVTNQQIVRVQWDFSRKWSAVALRDENGAFSIDIQYRKRFK
jgi:translocation and assembly module TamB